MPPQPAAPFGPVDQLMTPTITGPPGLSSNTGPPESPVQAPIPSRVLDGIDQPDLERAGLAGGNEAGDTRGAAALAVAAHGDADAGDGEAAADESEYWACRRRPMFSLEWNFQLQQCHVGGGAMRLHRLHVEVGMDRDGAHILQLRLPSAP